MTFLADTLVEDADVWIIPIAEADLPPTSLSGKPFQIVAKGQNSKQSIRKFAKTATIELSYDPDTLRGNEGDLVMYYYDENREEWVPLSSWVDRKRHILYASTDHLTPFDFQAVSWEAARRPDVKAAQTSLFTGAGTYSYPLTLPEGPGGLKPNLTLNYNSQVVDGDGLEPGDRLYPAHDRRFGLWQLHPTRRRSPTRITATGSFLSEARGGIMTGPGQIGPTCG